MATTLKSERFVHTIILSEFDGSTTNARSTGKKAAFDAGKILGYPKSTKKEKEVVASDRAQRKGAAPSKPKN